MNSLRRFKLFLWYFSHFKVRMIGYLRPHLIQLDDEQVVIRLPLRKRSRNHLQSMYFGALAVGADLAGGLHAYYYADKMQAKISLAFKSFQGQFLHRPESDVYFVCSSGYTVKTMIEESQVSHQRINRLLTITAYTHYLTAPQVVANFSLELSVKVL